MEYWLDKDTAATAAKTSQRLMCHFLYQRNFGSGAAWYFAQQVSRLGRDAAIGAVALRNVTKLWNHQGMSALVPYELNSSRNGHDLLQR